MDILVSFVERVVVVVKVRRIGVVGKRMFLVLRRVVLRRVVVRRREEDILLLRKRGGRELQTIGSYMHVSLRFVSVIYCDMPRSIR